VGQHLHRDLNAEQNSRATKTRYEIHAAGSEDNQVAQCLYGDFNAEHNSSDTKTRNETAGNEDNQVGQYLYRDFNAEHNSSVTKTWNEIQLPVRKTMWATTCTEISTLNTTATALKQGMRYSLQ
jgi:hypothetical protein